MFTQAHPCMIMSFPIICHPRLSLYAYMDTRKLRHGINHYLKIFRLVRANYPHHLLLRQPRSVIFLKLFMLVSLGILQAYLLQLSFSSIQDARVPVTEEPCLEEVPSEVQKSMKSLSNGMTEIGNEEMSNASDSSKKPDESNPSNKSLDVNTSNVDTEDIHTGKVGKVDTKQVKIAKRRGRKPRSTKPSNSSLIESYNEAEVTCQKVSDKGAEESPDPGKDAHTSIDEDSHVDPDASPEKEQLPYSSPEPLEKEVNVSSGSPSKSLLDGSPMKDGVSEKEENLAQEDALTKSAPGKVFAGTSGKEISPESHSEKNLAHEDKLSVDSAPADSAPAEADDVNSDSEVKPQKCFGKKEESFVQEHESKDPRAAVVAVAADGGSDLETSIKKKGGQDEPSENLNSAKVSDGSSDSENKVQKQSGKKTESLSQEVAPVESLSPKIDDKISDSEDKPRKRSGKKAARTKKTTRITKGKILGRKGTSKIQTEESSDEDAEPQQSAEEDGSDSESKPLVTPGKESTSRHRGKPLESSGKGNASDTKLPSMKQDTANEESDSETNNDGSDSETKPVLQSGKGKRSRSKGKPLKKFGKGSVSGMKLSNKKEDTTNKDKDSSKKNSERRAHGKSTKERVSLKNPAKDDDQVC